jgi:large subunit ribosomal protein L29
VRTDEIRELTGEEITDRIGEMREELFKLRFRAATQQLENPALIRNLRRDIARLRTIERERAITGTGPVVREKPVAKKAAAKKTARKTAAPKGRGTAKNAGKQK